ncbi:hypothetical protein CSQ85_12305 [Bifidobacterium rousetti]|uniref:hypothetical protein n=1 Tax=Bifidobacterium rousetti TaxID=2045439 RepID=UPI00123C757A|nr:hypothetical protein [Bifidobacterium rousetti]KAA8815704.1 hypothetical protein CSQ85_12305 [Bifidobacterium rousetti]
MNLTELAEQLAERFDTTVDGTEQLADIYLTQIEQVDGKTIDRDDISQEDAEAVATAMQAGMDSSVADDNLAGDLVDISERIRDLQDELDDLTERRNRLVNRLLDRANSVRDICEWSGLSRARVYAIKDNR